MVVVVPSSGCRKRRGKRGDLHAPIRAIFDRLRTKTAEAFVTTIFKAGTRGR